MEASAKNRRQLRLQGATFAVLFLALVGLIAWLSTRYHFEADWTAGGRHTLAPASIELLATMQDPITVTAFARNSELTATRKQIADLIGRYQQQNKDLTLRFVDPDMAPDQVRAEGITLDGELVIEYEGRKQHVQSLSEQEVTNTLQGLVRSGARQVVFLEGHGERSPDGAANHDLGSFAGQLRNKGLATARLNLTATPELPKDAAVLVIASPQVDLFPGEVKLVQQYVDQGGNLLWLIDPDGLHQLDPLAAELGIKRIAGTVVDPTTQLLGINNAAFALVARYPQHPVTNDLGSVSLFPFAVGLDLSGVQAPWQATPLLRTEQRSWSETGSLKGTIRYDQGGDTPGPLTLGAALERPRPGAKADGGEAPQQRVVVIGDGDFLSNTYLGNGSNLDLGERLINWLAHDDSLIKIPPKTSPDTQLKLTPVLSGVIGFGFLFIIPGALVGAGIVIWLKRRKR